MKRLILDYMRRWWWVLAVATVVEFVIGWQTPNGRMEKAFGISSSIQVQIALFTGALLLSFDLQRGIARTVAALPLTARQIGRAWWLVAVGIPAIVLGALLFLGAAISCSVQPGIRFPWDRLAMGSLLNLLWLGTGFTIILSSMRGLYGNWFERTRNVLFSLLWGAMIGGGFLFFQNVLNEPIRFAGFLAFGAVLTLVGWIYAEPLALGRVSFRLSSLQSNPSRGQHRAPSGYGGISYLISHTMVRAFMMGLAMLALMPLFIAIQGHMKTWQNGIEILVNNGSNFPLWFVVLFAVIPTMIQLRYLRTLPMSATRLAAVMIVMPFVPLIALGVVMAGTAGAVLGTVAAFKVLNGFAFTLASAALCVIFVGSLGVGRSSFALIIFTMIIFQTLPMWLQVLFKGREIPFSLTGTIVGFIVTAAFLLTRRSLMRNSKAYRVQANPFINSAWGMGR